MSPNFDDIKLAEDTADVITVKLLDHSGLGGPMGSERVRDIQSWSFVKPDMAFTFAEIVISRVSPPETAKTSIERLRRDFHQSKGRGGIDLGAYGVEVRRETHRIITGFTHKRKVEVEETVS